MSSKGFDAVKTQNKDILKLYNSKKGTGGPKAAFGDVQYMNEIIRKARSWTPAKAYSVGGVRIQSFSDYVPRMVFDYVQMVYDLAATKLPAHAYTKEALFAKQFGLTGIKINMSLIPAIAEGGIAPGLDANGNYVWAGESFDYDTAKEIQNAEGYTENCGTICVGVSYDHIKKLLRDPNIRMVIPYHKSGLNPIVAHMNKIAEFTDYTNEQRTKGKDGKALEKDFDFNKALHDMGGNASPKAVADQYLKWCASNGYTARFAEFAAEDNYYKLLEDFTLYDKDGNYVPQREVRAVFPKEGSAFGSMKDLIKSGLEEDAIIEGKRDSSLSSIVDEIQKTIPKTEAEIAETQVEQADRDLEAVRLYSTRDSDGNALSKAQQEYFKDSKVRDEDGNLLLVHHATDEEFTVFDRNMLGATTDNNAQDVALASTSHVGFWFNTSDLSGKMWTRRSLSGYLNINNPYTTGSISSLSDDIVSNYDGDYTEAKEAFERGEFEQVKEMGESFREYLESQGYDGIIVEDEEFGGTSYIAFDSNQFKNADNVKPTEDPDIRYSLRDVAPVQPSSTEWKRGVTTSEAMKIYPNLWNVTAVESEKRNPTQITSTVNTYNKIYDILKAEGFDGTILDASSGLGYGTRSGIENYGFQVDDIEPYPDKGYKPKYTDYSTLNKTYDAIISNAVLNVLPQDQRDALVVKMGEMLNPGGRMFINVRSLAEIQNLQKAIDKKTGKLKNVVISDSEVAETTKGSYQKGFRKSELVSYLKDALGDGYKVEPTNRFGGVSVIVTKDSAFFSKRTADDRIYEREFLRLAKLYEKESDLNARLKKEAKRHKEDSATWEREFKRLMNEYNKVGRNVKKLQSELDSRKEKYAESMAKYRQRAEMELKEQSQRYQESRKLATERRHNTETRHSIEKILHDMDRRMNHPVEGKYIPKPMRSAVAEVLSSIDRSSGREGKAADSLQKLVTQYREMAKSNSVGMAMFDETVAEMLQTAASYNKPLREMNAEELDHVKKALKAMDHVIKKAVVVESFQIPGLSKEQNVFEFAKRMMRETAATGKQKRGKAYRYLLTQARPETALRWFGGYAQNSAWEAVYKGLNAAQKKSMNIQMDLGSGFNELANAKEASTLFDRKNLVDVGLVDENGNNVKITRGMMLSLYMHLLNDQNTRHVMTGGLTIPDMKEYYKGNIKQAYNDGVRVFGTSQEIAGVQSEIRELERQMETDGYDSSIENQIERLRERVNEIMDAGNAYMDSIRGRIEKLMSDYDVRIIEATQELYRKSQGYLNEATNTMYGFDKASVENYFPIVSDPDFLSAKFDSISADFNLENAGFMKERNNGANPILLSDIIGTNESQVKRTSQYAAFAPVVKDFNKVYSITEPGYTQSVQSVFSKQFGNEGKTYIEHLLADINGGGMAYKEISGIDVLLRKARGNMAAATLSVNPRVALSQAASLPTAAAELGYASVALSLTKSFKKADMKLIAKYSPLLWYRMQGNSTTEIGDMQKSTTAMGKFDKATRWLTGWISSVDAWTVKRLWFASEYWVKSHTSLQEGSDAYYQAVAEKFDATVERTQPNYSTLQRSDVLRSKNEVTNMLTMFSTQRSQNFNILLDAALDFNYALKNKTGVKQAFQKYQLAISSQLVAAGTYVAVRFFADMLLHAVDAYRDDDDELTKESIQKELLNQFLSTLSGTTLFGSELYDAARAIITKEKYYPVSLSGIGSVVDASEGIVKALQNPSKSNLVKAAKGIATVRGIPLNNALKIVTGMSRHIEDFKNGAFGSMEAGVERTVAQQQRRWYRAIVNGDQMTADEIYDQMISDKMRTVKSDGTYPTEDEAKGSVYAAQKQILRQMDPRIKQAAKAQFDGDNEKRIRIAKEIIAEGHFSQDMVVTAITAELNAMKSADSEYEFDLKAYSLYTVDDYVESILSGKYATASTEIMDDLIDAKMRNGMTMEEAEKSVETAAKKGLKTLYIENREIDQASAIDALQAITGDDFDDASGAVHDWFKDYIRDEFESGNLSESETIKELTGEGGLDEDSAYQKVTYWAFRKENPSMDWSESQILKYNSDIKPTGITVQLYNDYLTERKKCTGVDSDGDGKADSGSVKSQALKVIDAMPITDEQKDALYLQNGWSENTLRKAPWH